MAASNVPVTLRAWAKDDVFLSAEIFSNGRLVGVATYCCPLCRCVRPLPGQETLLRIPASLADEASSMEIWQGWANPPDGLHHLTARAVGENGTVVESAPVTISVREIELLLRRNSEQEGSYLLVIPNGALLDEGRLELEASGDLRNWTRLGPFSPGNVAAFYWDTPPASAGAQRFYRAVWVPPAVR